MKQELIHNVMYRREGVFSSLKITYEALPPFCRNCSKLGHQISECNESKESNIDRPMPAERRSRSKTKRRSRSRPGGQDPTDDMSLLGSHPQVAYAVMEAANQKDKSTDELMQDDRLTSKLQDNINSTLIEYMAEDTEQAQLEYHEEVQHDTNSLLQQTEREVTAITEGQHTIEPAPNIDNSVIVGMTTTKKHSQRKTIGVHARAMTAKKTLPSVADDMKTIAMQKQKMIILRKWEDEAEVDKNILDGS